MTSLLDSLFELSVLVGSLFVYPRSLVLPGDGLPEFLVAEEDEAEGDPGQPPQRVQRRQLQALIHNIMELESIYWFNNK